MLIMGRRTISISINENLVEDVDMSRGNMARSQFIERVLFLFFHKGKIIREKPKGEIKEEVRDMPNKSAPERECPLFVEQVRRIQEEPRKEEEASKGRAS